ncbi:hypothetical protein ACKWTF_015030 [Chironomus riparius]
MELHCIFYSQKFDAGYNCYRCLITNREIPLNKELNLIGRHEGNKTNDNVTHLEFSNCRIRKIPQKLTKIFPNLKVLRIINSELRKICKADLAEYKNIERLIFDFNEIEFLPGNLFEDFQNLELISFRGNELKIIEPNILDSLDGLQHVNFAENPNYSKCHSILSCKDSNAEIEDVKVQIIEKFFILKSEIVQNFVKNLKNPLEVLKKYENMSIKIEVKLKIVELRLKIFEEFSNRKVENLKNSELNLNQEIKNFVNFESKLIREINQLRNFEGKLTQEIQELKNMNSGQTFIRQQSEPTYGSSFNILVAALRQELQSWRDLAKKLNQDVQKLRNSEAKLSLEVQNLKINLQIESLKKSDLMNETEATEMSTNSAEATDMSKNLAATQKLSRNQENEPNVEDTNENSNFNKNSKNMLHEPAFASVTDVKCEQNDSNSNNSTSNKHHSFIIDIKKYIQEDITKDFIIKIHEQEFLVHKFLLAARSATLADILNKNPFIDSLSIVNISIESFHHILRFIYTDELPVEDEINFVDLFDAAGRLKIEDLKNFAGKRVLEKVNAANAIEIFNLSSKYEHKMLRQKSFEEIKKNFEDK